MPEGSAAIALGAGMLAALNPCGFALFPAYLTMLLQTEDASRALAVARAVKLTAAMTAGFAAVFAVFGLAIAPVASSVQEYLPWFTIGLGVVLVGVGGWLLAGRSLTGPRSRARGGAPITGTVRSMFGFGVSYALASLSCTIAPFLAVVVSAFRSESMAAGAALFLLYAGGMGLVVGTAAVAVALARTSLVGRMRRAGRFIPLASGVLLVVVGAYVAWYGWWEIRVLRGGDVDDPVIDVALDLQLRMAQAVDSWGAPDFAVALAILVVLGVATSGARRLGRRRRSRAPQDAEHR